MKFFSLIIPMHQSQDTIIQCLDSIMDQDFLNYEILLIDDDSSFEARELVEEYRISHPEISITLIVTEDRGPAWKRNIGIEKASGEYIWFIDSDDEIEKEALRIAYNTIHESGCDILRFSCRKILNGKRCRDDSFFKEDLYETDRLQSFIFASLANSWKASMTCWLHIYKRELVKNIRFIVERKPYEDILFNCFVYPNASRIQVIGDILYRYYLRGDSIPIKSSCP